MSIVIQTNSRTGAKRIINNTTTPATIIDNATAAQVAAYAPCPTHGTDKESVCLTPNANAVGGVASDPSLVVSGWQISVHQITNAGVLTVLSAKLYNAALATDLSATHTIVACPAPDSFVDVAVCAV